MLEYLILFFAAFAAAAISGSAGFGGALLLLPLLVLFVGPAQAVPLLTVAQLIGNISRAGFGFSEINWKPVGLFLLAAIPFAVLGAYSFIQLPKEIVTRVIGLTIFVFVLLKYFDIFEFRKSTLLLLTGGGVVGFVSGLVGSAGPLSAAIFFSLGLPPVAYIASEAVTALSIHGVKIMIYQSFISLDQAFWVLALTMGAAMVLGTWTAKKFIEKIPKTTFQTFVGILLVLISLYMVIFS